MFLNINIYYKDILFVLTVKSIPNQTDNLNYKLRIQHSHPVIEINKKIAFKDGFANRIYTYINILSGNYYSAADCSLCEYLL